MQSRENLKTDPAKILFDSFDVFASVPGGVQKLRELILQLAVQGKLVPQDPNDEPASVLLEKIKSEKTRLTGTKKSKKQKPLPPIENDEIPFEVPGGWQWGRFSEVATIASNLVKPDSYLEFPHIAPNHIEKATGRLLEYTTVKEDGVTSGKHQFYSGQLLYSKIRPNLSKAVIVDFDGLCSADMYPVDAHIHARYLHQFILSSAFLSQVVDAENRLAMPKVNQEQLSATTVAVPPLAEQHRIVAKVDQLMALCDELETKHTAKQTEQHRLNGAALDALLSAQNQADFDQAWQRVAEHFDLLYDVPESVPKLRQAILQLAVQGKLVPQDPNDEPASVLLEKIKVEKDRLVKAGKIKKQKPLPPIEPGEVPFEVPVGWEWVRVGSLSKIVEYGTSQKAKVSGPGIPILRMNNINGGRVSLTNIKYVPSDIDELPRLYLKRGDLLFNRTNSYELVGKTGVFGGDDNAYTFASYLIRIRTVADVVPEYLNLSMNSPYYRRTQIEPEITQQCGQANFNGTKLQTSLVPIPPLSEQYRIVARLDQLMDLCDELEGKLNRAQQGAEKLVGAVVGDFQGIAVAGATARSHNVVIPSEKPAAESSVTDYKCLPPHPSIEGEADDDGNVITSFLDMNLDAQTEAVFEALWCKGPVSAEEALRLVAENLRDCGLVEFKRLRKDGALGQAIVQAIQRGLKYGYLDKPGRGTIRAVVSDPKDYDDEDWRMIVDTALGERVFDNEDRAVRDAAEWARENVGLKIKQLRRNGLVFSGLSTAIKKRNVIEIRWRESFGNRAKV